ILIDQRNPLIRVFPKHGESYYIDVEGKFMPLSNKYASHLIVANGNILGNFDRNEHKDIFSYNNQTLIDLFALAKYLKENEFWNSQIEQVYVKKNNDFELIPRVGSHEILLGDIHNLDKKLRNLKAVYKKGFSKESWIKYHYINLKYENQVICSKR
ncbi:cell division protein FtsQ/DivIB, partial [Bacteroidota bacterium]